METTLVPIAGCSTIVRMDLISYVTRLGGSCARRGIVEQYGRSAVSSAVRAGVLVRVGRGRYALASASAAVQVAATWGGILSMRSAAQRLGWGLRAIPERPDVTFPRNHHLDPAARRDLVPHWSDIDPNDVERGATGVRRTLIDCMRMLRLDESLSIVDSALRSGDVTPAELRGIARSMRGRGRARAVAVAAMATSKAANPFESTLRALATAVPGLACLPQHPIRTTPKQVLHPDLADPGLRLIIEAESFEWHGESPALARDCVRYNTFALLGWTVVRFSWSQVMHRPGYVIDTLSAAVHRARQHANVQEVARARPG